MRGRYGNRVAPRFAGRANKPARTWVSLQTATILNATATASAVLMSLQANTDVTALTSDPPEDVTILRVRGHFQVLMSGSADAEWTLALLAQDLTWTPGTFEGDADKRMLWTRTFTSSNSTSDFWTPDWVRQNTTIVPLTRDVTEMDISPKVKLEPGRGLVMVAYERTGTATFSWLPRDMRLLFQRSRRR